GDGAGGPRGLHGVGAAVRGARPGLLLGPQRQGRAGRDPARPARGGPGRPRPDRRRGDRLRRRRVQRPGRRPAVPDRGLDAHAPGRARVRQPAAAAIEQAGLAAPIGAPPAGATWAGVLANDKLSGWAAQRFVDALARAARDLDGPGGTSDATLAILARYTGVSVGVVRTIPPYAWDRALRPDAAALAGLQATYRRLGLLQYRADLAPARISDGSY